jgi:uncharacterized membrane protein
MSERIEQLSRRRKELIARSDNERHKFAQAADALESELQSIDRTVARVREFAKPAVLVAGIASLFYFGRGKTFKLLSRGFLIYSALRRLLSRQ